MAERVGVRSRPGLVDVLVGRASLFDALVTGEEHDGRLRILPAGSVPPNPSELVASAQMQALLAQLSAVCDLLIIDSPPVLAVSDAIPMLNETSGVIVVSRLHAVRREPLRRLRQILSTAHVPILGVVATGANQDGIYGYGYYASDHGDEPSSEGTNGTVPLDAANVGQDAEVASSANGEAHADEHRDIEHDVSTYR